MAKIWRAVLGSALDILGQGGMNDVSLKNLQEWINTEIAIKSLAKSEPRYEVIYWYQSTGGRIKTYKCLYSDDDICRNDCTISMEYDLKTDKRLIFCRVAGAQELLTPTEKWLNENNIKNEEYLEFYICYIKKQNRPPRWMDSDAIEICKMIDELCFPGISGGKFPLKRASNQM